MITRAILVVLLCTNFVPAVVISFDEGGAVSTAGTPVGNGYQSQGLIFSSPSFVLKSSTDPNVIVPTSPNFLDLAIAYNSNASISFVSTSNSAIPGTVDWFSFTNAGLTNGFGYYNGLSIVARGLSGNVLYTTTISPVGPHTGRAVFATTINTPGIHSVEFGVISNAFDSNALAPIDTFSFGPITAVPEPTAFCMLVLATIAALSRRVLGRLEVAM